MKKPIVILTLLSVMLGLSAASYYVGAEGGVTFNTVIAGKGYRSYEYDWAVGCKASLPFVVQFNDNFALETGLSLYGKSYSYLQKVDASGEKQTNFDLSVKNGFMSIPLLLRVYIPVGKFDFYAAAGGWLGFWAYGSRKGSVMNGNDKSESVEEKTDLSLYNRFDAGVSAKLGFDVDFGPVRGYVEGEYGLTLTDMNVRQKHGSFPVHNSTFSLTVGALMEIAK